ncbi:Cd(II)/Pb(II)-responsive transcriptional regulator [Paraglaciecola arctica]|uniref:HTH-type transcriptional regulator zntR n=1 Tax=Paraglaciecola arctica BSs20135 TaxID=493475 RepID=K6YS40_9ALTE|nr:Cd(II)/Pb(II)-responsive transcriptional regulator [Paraglaciecola arctica]GAC19498.1 HTH-type transcriptional regulator zntR [Paraglaciecola arctica BSs20135]
MKIGKLSTMTGFSVQAIRYYEKEGLIARPSRTEGNFRLYHPDDVKRLEFVKHCRNLDMTLKEIKQMLEIRQFPERSCESINLMIDAHLIAVVKRIDELCTLKEMLSEMQQSCHSGSAVASCGILKNLEKN